MTRITVPRIILILAALIGGFWLVEQTFRIVYRIADILLIFGLAWLLKLLLDPLMRRLRLWHVPRVLSILIAYGLFIGAFVVMVIWLTPQLAGLGQGTRQLAREIALRADQAANWLQARGVEVNPHALTMQIITLGSDFASTVAGRAFEIAQSVLSVLGKFALVITVSIYMSLTRGSMGDWLRPIIPPRWRDEYDEFLTDVKNAYSASIRGYFYVVALGTLLSSVILFG
ncbi:MAG: AI-2E family transporter, partial [Herpetosiphonaceae bacterium]|nr:AI-2E family transporter [Herpetosiphonaceae bacterium]